MEEKKGSLGLKEEGGVDSHAVSQSGVKGNLAQINAKLGKVGENRKFLYDSADESPAGEDVAEPAEGTRY